MKMMLTYPHLPVIEIEMQADECAQLLQMLQAQRPSSQDQDPQLDLFVAQQPPVIPDEGLNPRPPAQQATKPAARKAKVAEGTQAEPAKQHATKPVARKQPEDQASQLATASRAEAAKPAQEDESARPYNGKTNRRHRVLEIFQDFASAGKVELSIGQITQAFEERFPNEDANHLDQVVRDLENKTSQVFRVRRGIYSLS